MPASLKLRFIKTASAADLKRIITIYRAQGWWTPGDKPALLRRLIKGSHCFVVAEQDGRLIGIGRAISDGASDAYIQDVAVLSPLRGAGAGSAIIRALQKRLKADGIKWLGLIAQDNSAPFYARLGFTPLKHASPMLAKGTHV
ncbi:MAG TPA: GNAT family N-acetyltransferase [Elusimicrobiales bacterium]|nr:GNAT family N-acetyltransferase [Elusimicrobiales bacterium]